MRKKNFDFFNLFYSFGAAIVLLGALFKVIDTPYADYIFITGLVVEILVFLVSAFVFSEQQKPLAWERVFPELAREVDEEDEVEESEVEEEEDNVMEIQPAQSVASLGTNMQEVAQNLAIIAESFKQMRVTITHLDNSVNQLHHANAGYKEEMQTLKRNLSDINSYYSEFINALNTRVSNKRD